MEMSAYHDLGAYGAGGKVILEEQGVLGEIDVLVGSFSKTFASTGGYAAASGSF
jgi:glycine C-acetyltransferase